MIPLVSPHAPLLVPWPGRPGSRKASRRREHEARKARQRRTRFLRQAKAQAEARRARYA